MVRKYSAKSDDNQPEIVAEFRRLGASVTPTHMVGSGFVDIVVGHEGRNYLVEIKDGAKQPSQRKLTPDEQEYHANWKGTLHIVETIDDCAGVLG